MEGQQGGSQYYDFNTSSSSAGGSGYVGPAPPPTAQDDDEFADCIDHQYNQRYGPAPNVGMCCCSSRLTITVEMFIPAQVRVVERW